MYIAVQGCSQVRSCACAINTIKSNDIANTSRQEVANGSSEGKSKNQKINTKQPLIKVCTKLATNKIHTYLYTNTSVCIFFVLVLFEGIKIQNNQPQAFNNITKQITERLLDYTIAGFKLI